MKIIKGKTSKRALLLFTNSPERESEVKSIFTDKDLNISLYRHFLKHILSVIEDSKTKEDFDLIVAADELLIKNCPKYFYHISKRVRLIEQYGNSFGEKFLNTIREAFGLGYENIVIIGNDSPEITHEIIEDCFEKLEKRDQVVIGPSVDGGFYLLGINEFRPGLFNNIKWNTPEVLQKLVKNVAALGKCKLLLPVLCDLDNYSDFRLWLKSGSYIARRFKKMLFIEAGYRFPGSSTVLSFISPTYCCKLISQKPPPADSTFL